VQQQRVKLAGELKIVLSAQRLFTQLLKTAQRYAAAGAFEVA
jgi:hypothetical protein